MSEEFDFARAKEAVARVAAYTAKAETVEQFALAMQADLQSPFFDFDPIAHATDLQNEISELLDKAYSAFDDEEEEA